MSATENEIKGRAVDEETMKHFMSKQFDGEMKTPKLNKGVRKFYPELEEMINLQIKQEKLRKLRAEDKNLSYPPTLK